MPYSSQKKKDTLRSNILKSIYYALFESRNYYASITWGEKICTINHLYILQERYLELLTLKSIMLIHLLCFVTQIPDKVKI